MAVIRNNQVCPVERSGMLDGAFRRWLHNPNKILKDFIKEGMTVLDVGCGPGLFSIAMANMVGKHGKVIAADLQEEMLAIVKRKIAGTVLENTIILHKCSSETIGITEQVDFVLAFYMVHEVPNQAAFFQELHKILKPDGRILVVEPSFHVSKHDFELMQMTIQNARLAMIKDLKIPLSRSILLRIAN